MQVYMMFSFKDNFFFVILFETTQIAHINPWGKLTYTL